MKLTKSQRKNIDSSLKPLSLSSLSLNGWSMVRGSNFAYQSLPCGHTLASNGYVVVDAESYNIVSCDEMKLVRSSREVVEWTYKNMSSAHRLARLVETNHDESKHRITAISEEGTGYIAVAISELLGDTNIYLYREKDKVYQWQDTCFASCHQEEVAIIAEMMQETGYGDITIEWQERTL